MRFAGPFLAALLTGCAATGHPPAMKISNLELGLARPDGKGGWEIYEKGNDFPFVANGTCTVGAEQKPCMRHAVSFEYEALSESTTVECTAAFSEVGGGDGHDHGDHGGEVSGTTELKGRRGKALWPGYAMADGDAGPHRTRVRCTHDGREVLAYEFTVTQPRR
jgi:hypothetical protein